MRSCSTCYQDFSARPVPVPAAADESVCAVVLLKPLVLVLAGLEAVGPELEQVLGPGLEPQQLDVRVEVPGLGSQPESHPGTGGTCSSASCKRSNSARFWRPFFSRFALCTRLHNHRQACLAFRVSAAAAAAAAAPDLIHRLLARLAKKLGPELSPRHRSLVAGVR